MATRKYIVLPLSEIDEIDWDCFCNSKGSVPIINNHFLVCYTGTKPSCVSSYPVEYKSDIIQRKLDPNDVFYEDIDAILNPSS